jgi:hypothetical protein
LTKIIFFVILWAKGGFIEMRKISKFFIILVLLFGGLGVGSLLTYLGSERTEQRLESYFLYLSIIFAWASLMSSLFIDMEKTKRFPTWVKNLCNRISNHLAYRLGW